MEQRTNCWAQSACQCRVVARLQNFEFFQLTDVVQVFDFVVGNIEPEGMLDRKLRNYCDANLHLIYY